MTEVGQAATLPFNIGVHFTPYLLHTYGINYCRGSEICDQPHGIAPTFNLIIGMSDLIDYFLDCCFRRNDNAGGYLWHRSRTAPTKA